MLERELRQTISNLYRLLSIPLMEKDVEEGKKVIASLREMSNV